MKANLTHALLGAMALVLAAPALAQDQDRDQDRAQEQIRDQDMSGSQLMTPEEREAYRARMRNATTAEERERIRAEHHGQMSKRAQEQGVTLPDEPPARGPALGREGGKGSGGGMGRHERMEPGPGGGRYR